MDQLADPRREGERRWSQDQLEEHGVEEPVPMSVMMLLEQWWDLPLKRGPEPELVLELFNELARGRSITPLAVPPEWEWAPAQPGQIMVRDKVRVKSDAYGGDAGKAHNGRLGRVVGIRGGDIVVKYEDERKPVLESVHHSPHALEKRTA